MIPRTLFDHEHEAFRDSVKRFLAQQCTPFHEQWEEDHRVPRQIWERAGELGMLNATTPQAYGGLGLDRRFSMIAVEEVARAGLSGLNGFNVHDICAGYLINFGTEEQKQQWLPKMASGEVISAVAMTEPDTGSDLQAVKTRAVLDGDDYVINGAKTFISNGTNSDLIVVIAKTGNTGKGSRDISLILVEADRVGVTKSKPLRKVGLHAQDTTMLFFQDVRVPKDNILGGEPGQGFYQLMKELAWERLSIGILAIAASQAVLEQTIDYTRERKAFGTPIIEFQNSRFKLADLKTEIVIGQTYIDRCMELILQNELSPQAAAAAKLWCTELYSKVVDQCVQLHGGNGYMLEYPVARHYLDSRVNRIYGGANDIMRELVARTL
ncbi:acyl-CoA dehydrogenase [Pseudomonas umsongensis]|jgi:alkylation response protein AidB-like acyl-CoA dehydrogenase|uniref:Acyl-CoA dehydrogenase n=1 Tax=Pseudomonas umsongensis TaxID=198618 RepID=A0ABX4E0B6_9PSED|nr:MULTISPECIES: acyl-CoA dehydrogenase family protein [Pseudomonas]EPA98090.1 acyl-CoA dehydrogenase [Pseudomonas sp. G5(2012)]MBT9571144.1 acyl-CoA dehydrogenase family protein [Pseudomonas umsongensis]OXR35070.1 acyl-CoA dehydrogenase [Pseudomonas umsongensis]QFG30257.1 acyl-CoA dehydrogenase [Pseudomonas umsongensis]SDT21162.1 Acyl-CoA dehydrogenase [Pseudomonas umsongensis]